MRFVVLALVLEVWCAITLACYGAPFVALLVLAAAAVQGWAGVRAWDRRQARARTEMVGGLLKLGMSHEEAAMHAAYTYPDVRVFARLAADVLRSVGDRKEVL